MISKVCRNSENEARITLEVTLQLSHQDPDSSIYRNFGTNDRMLQYKRINTYFLSDTFWVMNIVKSIRKFTCMQLFVSDKGFVKVYGIISEKEFLQAIKLFWKGVGVPTSFIVDPSGAQTKNGAWEFFYKFSTTMKVLE